MMIAILFLLLASGESSDLAVDPAVCRRVPAALAAGAPVRVDLASGRQEPVVAASCFVLPLPVGACDDEASGA